MTSFLFEGRAARGRCQSVIKCDDFHIWTALCIITLKSVDPERTFNYQQFLNVWALVAV